MYPTYNHTPSHPSGYANYSGNPPHMIHHTINPQHVVHHPGTPSHVVHQSNGTQVIHTSVQYQHSNTVQSNGHNGQTNNNSNGNFSPAPGGYPANPRITVSCFPENSEYGFPTGLAPYGLSRDRNMYGFHVSTAENMQTEGISPEVQQWFNTIDRDHSGKMNAKELQAALFNGQGKHFSEGVCHLMINIFDKNQNGTIEAREFQELYHYINNWMNVFHLYDKDDTDDEKVFPCWYLNKMFSLSTPGFIEEAELGLAIQQMGFRFSSDFFKLIVSRSDTLNHRQISADQFIAFCVQLQRFTEIFRTKDKEQKGQINIGFEDFLKVIFSCSA